MKNRILANVHWLIILYGAFNLYTIFEEKNAEKETVELSIPIIKKQIAITKRKFKQIETFKNNLEKSKERVKEVVKQIEKVQKQLPTESRETEVAGYIDGLGQRFKFQGYKITPEKEELKGFYFTKHYLYQARGTFLQSLIFLENLEKSERILNVLSISLKNEEQYRRGKFQVLDVETKVESYRYNTNYKEKSGVEEIENKFKVN